MIMLATDLDVHESRAHELVDVLEAVGPDADVVVIDE